MGIANFLQRKTAAVFPIAIGTLAAVFAPLFAQGQAGFYHNYPISAPSPNTVVSGQLVEEAPGGYRATSGSNSNSTAGASKAYAVETDVQGIQIALFTTTFPAATPNYWPGPWPVGNKTYVQFDTTDLGAGNGSAANVQLFDVNGQLLWQTDLPQATPNFYHLPRTARPGSDGSIFVAGYANAGNGVSNQKAFVAKISAAGVPIWSSEVAVANSIAQGSFGLDLYPTPDGGALLFLNSQAAPTLLKISGTGTTLWNSSTTGYFQYTYAQENSAGEAFFIRSNATPGAVTQAKISKIVGGTSTWEKDFGQLFAPSISYGQVVLATADGGALVVGKILGTSPFGNNLPYAARWDGAGNLLWKKTLGAVPTTVNFKTGKALADGSFLFSGDESGKIFLLKINGLGQIQPNAVAGTLREDTDANCQADAAEPGFGPRIVRAKIGSDEYFGLADASGHFEVADLPAGPYDLTVAALPHSFFDVPCPPVTVAMPDTADITLAQDLSMRKLVDCPLMTLDVGTWALRRCVNSTYTIKYCNVGTAEAADVSVQLNLPSEMAFVSASQAATVTGNSVQFEIGTVAAGQCASISMIVHVQCDSTHIGDVLCIDAHIFPDTFCTIPGGWSGASIEAVGYCAGGTAHFRLKNGGFGATTVPLDWQILNDSLIVAAGTLPAGFAPGAAVFPMDSTAGSSVTRIICQQEPGHPAPGDVSIALTNCNGQGNPGSTAGGVWGFFNQFWNNSGSPFGEEACQPIVGSYDPNEKSAQPQGVGVQHFIEPKTPLTYRLHFQNEGTDTAFVVVLRDTLDAALDPATLKIGASSHPFTWDISGRGQLVFRFANIGLPPKSVDEVGSNGFVQFEILPRADAALGTRIENRAGIYFDFNAVVLTNAVFHTLGHKFLTSSVLDAFGQAVLPLAAAPNPAGQMVRLSLSGAADGVVRRVVLVDVFGKIVAEKNFTGRAVELVRGALPAGLFLAQILENGRTLAAGKVIFE